MIVLDTDHLSVLERSDQPGAVALRARPRIGTMDLKIAAIVVSRDATLLPRNLAGFRQVPGLQIEDWTA
jgi:predicted nucleic acid-binding protein